MAPMAKPDRVVLEVEMLGRRSMSISCSHRENFVGKPPKGYMKTLPFRELTYPTLGKGTDLQKHLWEGLCLFPATPTAWPKKVIHRHQAEKTVKANN